MLKWSLLTLLAALSPLNNWSKQQPCCAAGSRTQGLDSDDEVVFPSQPGARAPKASTGLALAQQPHSKTRVLKDVDNALRIPIIHNGTVFSINTSIHSVLVGGLTTRLHQCNNNDGNDNDDDAFDKAVHTPLERAIHTLCAIAAHGYSPQEGTVLHQSANHSMAATDAPYPSTVWLGGSNASKLTSVNIAKWKHALAPAQGNALLGALVRSEEPFLVARMGLGSEPIACEAYASGQHSFFSSELRTILHRDVGIYPPSDAQIRVFAAAYIEAIAAADVVVEWGNKDMPSFSAEQALLRRYASTKPLIHPRSIEPYYHSTHSSGRRSSTTVAAGKPSDVSVVVDQVKNGHQQWRTNSSLLVPWTHFLRNRTVLVVHPFAESIASQYGNVTKRRRVFHDPRVLPDFAALKTVKCVQSAAGAAPPHANWTMSLQVMQQRISQVGDFDIALLGCGGYGLPLAAFVRSKLNRSAM